MSPKTSDPADAVVKSLSKVPNLPERDHERPAFGGACRAVEGADPHDRREALDRERRLIARARSAADRKRRRRVADRVEGARRDRRHLLYERGRRLLHDGRGVSRGRRSGQLEHDEHDHHDEHR